MEIDDPKNPLSRRIGDYNIIRIGEIFAEKLYADPDPSFSRMFSGKHKEEFAGDFSDYLLQRLGGTNAYTKAKASEFSIDVHDFRLHLPRIGSTCTSISPRTSFDRCS